MNRLKRDNLGTRPADIKSIFFFSLIVISLSTVNAQSGPHSGIAKVNGTELYYEVAGSGHPLVLIHGGAVDSRAWDKQFEEFAKSYKVIRFDLRGSGKSGNRDAAFSNTADIAGLLDYLGIDNAHFIGISRGGGFAYDFTLKHPDRVSSLILVSANLGVHVPAYSEMFERSTAAGKASGAMAAAEVWGNDPHQGPVHDSDRAGLLQILAENLPRFRYFDGYEPVPQLADSDIPRSQRLAEIQVPTLIISGAHDNIVSKNNSRNWANGIKNAKLVVFPDAAHLVNIDQAQEFNDTVLKFLGDL